MASTRVVSLEGQFDSATHAEFWHYMAKHRHKPASYAKQEEVDQRIAAIAKSLGSCSFDTASGPNKWTPAHVAVLAGNEAGLKFLIGRKARLDIPDASGKTALDLAEKHHPELLPYLCPYHTISAKQRALCTKIVEPVCAPIHLGPFSYDANTDDFGVVNRAILFCRDIESSKKAVPADYKGIDPANLHFDMHIDHLIQDMQRIGEAEGFRLDQTRHVYYPRDHLTRTTRGRLISSSSQAPEHIDLAFQREASRACYFASNASFTSSHLLFKGALLGSSTPQKAAFMDCRFRALRRMPEEFRFPMEFGDKFTMTNSQGEKVLLIGEQNLGIIHAYCRLVKLFDEPGIELDPPKDLSNEQILQTAEEMYALGILKLNGASAFLDQKALTRLVQESHKQRRLDYKNLAIEMGLFKPFAMDQNEIEKARPLVAAYLAQRAIVSELIAKSFGVNRLFALPNCGYHLDTMMAPAPNGHMFLYDPDAAISVLKGIRANRASLELSEGDLALIENYLHAAGQIKSDLGPLFQRTKKVLEAAGIPVIPTPGIFFDVSYSKRYPMTSNVHFMNPVTGWSDKTQSYYYITTGTSAGDRLGSHLMDLYAQFLQLHIPGIHVHYVGRNPQNYKDFAQAMRLYNVEMGGAPQAGIHCNSFPIESNGHDHKEST